MFQWDIFYCDLGHNIGCEKNKTRPVLVIQKTKGYGKAQTVIIAPITIGEPNGKYYKHEVELTETHLGKIKGKIDLLQIRSVSKSRLYENYVDRLMKEEEYEKLFIEKGTKFETVQSKVKKVLKSLFCIDI